MAAARRHSACSPRTARSQRRTVTVGRARSAAIRRAFLTLTAPSFGPMHTRTVTPRGHVIACRCGQRHGPDDPLLGTALDPDSYDYLGAVLWQAHAGMLWARFAIALPKCQYWQQDHWSVQFSRGDVPVVRWDGSYWFDKGTGEAAGRLRHLTVGGRPASVAEAAALVRPVSPELAAFLMQYGQAWRTIAKLSLPDRYLRDTAEDAPETRSERMFSQLEPGFAGTDPVTGRRRGLKTAIAAIRQWRRD